MKNLQSNYQIQLPSNDYASHLLQLNQFLLVGTSGKSTVIYDLGKIDQNPVATFTQSGSLTDISLISETCFLTTSEDGNIRLWDLRDQKKPSMVISGKIY